MIGSNEKDHLKPNTKYCVIFIVTNNYKGADHDVVYYEKLKTTSESKPKSKPSEQPAKSGQFNHLYMLLLLLLLVPVGFVIYW